jgi:hypothetical protein
VKGTGQTENRKITDFAHWYMIERFPTQIEEDDGEAQYQEMSPICDFHCVFNTAYRGWQTFLLVGGHPRLALWGPSRWSQDVSQWYVLMTPDEGATMFSGSTPNHPAPAKPNTSG